jgi:hypothetical protein
MVHNKAKGCTLKMKKRKKEEIARSDIDGLYYKVEDLEWVVKPTLIDPGLRVSKKGSTPIKFVEKKPRTNTKKTKQPRPKKRRTKITMAPKKAPKKK